MGDLDIKNSQIIAKYKRQTYMYMGLSACALVFSVIAFAVIIDTNASRFFDNEQTYSQNETTVNVVFADFENPWSETYVKKAIADPLVLLIDQYRPNIASQIDVLIYANGLPFTLRKKNAVAMFSPDDNLIIVDGDMFKWLKTTGGGGPLSIQNVIIAHEGMHFIQNKKGVFAKGLHESDTYYENPIEVEAMIEGVTVAYALEPAHPFSIKFGQSFVEPKFSHAYPESPPSYLLTIESRTTATKWLRYWFGSSLSETEGDH